MQLTAKQIQYINYQLEEEGIRFWDIRIEMLDHVISDLEENYTEDYPFKKGMQEVFEKLGWKENFNGGGFEKLMKTKLNNYHKQSRKNSSTYLKSVFKTPKTCFFIAAFWMFLYQTYQIGGMLKGLYLVFVAAVLIAIGFSMYKYRLLQCVKLSQIISFGALPLHIFNMLMFIPSLFINDFKLFQYPIFTIVLFAILIPLQIIYIRYFFKALKETDKTYQKLLACN